MVRDETIEYWLIYRGLRYYLAIWKQRIMRRNFLRWQAANNWPKVCWICNGHIAKKDRSLDHVVPVSVCMELGLVGLLFDERNFQIAHRACNAARSSELKGFVPEKVQAMLKHLRNGLNVV